jgi:hypothetical protein
MPDWSVNLIVGVVTAILGFISGFLVKSYQIKIKQKAKGKNITQHIGEVTNERTETDRKRR